MVIALRPSTSDQFLDPLQFIRAEHDRQFEMGGRLLELAADQQLRSVIEWADELILFLKTDLPLHHKDEEDDLFPKLRELCSKDESIDQILAELDQDHAVESFLVRNVVIDLKTIVGGETLGQPERLFMDLRVFAEGQRRHLTWENKVVLPLASKRLGHEDLERMGRTMAARRGFSYPG